ncbi:MAG: sirohydrochlorin chelatase, partial [Mycobacteriales bacterium]
MTGVTRPLLAVAHGTRDAEGVEVIRALVALAARFRPGLVADVGFVDDASPSVSAALATWGSSAPVVVPLLLTAASHSKGDIPAAVQRARRNGAEVCYGRPLGPDPSLLAVVDERLAGSGAAADAPVVLAAAGAADPAANAEIAATARLLSEARGLAPVEVAFASATRPDVTEALDRLRRLGWSPAKVAVVPYFLAPGAFSRQVATLAAAAGAGLVTEVLGAHPALARLLLARYDEALAGDIRMNCDVCLYRTPVGGRRDAVGAAQRPHP